MEKDIQRRNVIDVLRSMDVGAIEVFPIVQKPSVTNTLNARLYKEKKLKEWLGKQSQM